MPRAPNPQSSAAALPIRALRYALLFGALLDFVGAVSFVLFSKYVENRLQLPPSKGFWPSYAAVFLVVLAVMYCVTAIDPARSLANLVVAILGRVAGMIFYLAYCWLTDGRQWYVFALSGMNGLFAVLYVWLLGPSGRAQLREALRPPPAGSTW